MFRLDMKNRTQYIIIIVLLVIFAIFALWTRLLPTAQLANTDILNLVGSDDPLYNLRQTEQMVRHFPTYAWFDPMTYFPFGTTVHWGPMMIWILAGASLLTGATTRPEIIQVALVIPPIMAAFMVPIIYLLVAKIADWKAGLFAGGLIAVVAGQYFFRSLFGYLDHHIAEVLFGALFSLCYIYSLYYSRQHPVDLKNAATIKIPFLYALITGFVYVLGLLTMPTMILFALIVGIFTIFQFIWDFYQKKSSDYLLLLNLVTFAFAIIAFLFIGIQTSGFQFNHYTIGHPVAYLFLIIISIALWIVAKVFQGKRFSYYPLSIIVIGGIALVGLMAFAPLIYGNFIGGLTEFFVQNPLYLTIQEARSWTIGEAWEIFNWGLILMALGFIVLLYRLWKEKRSEHLYVLVWSVLILYSAWQHIRYEYYFAVNLVVMAGIGIGFVIDLSWKDIRALLTPQPAEEVKERSGELKPTKKGEAGKKADAKQKKPAPKPKKSAVQVHYLNIAVLVVVLLFTAMFVNSSANYDYQMGSLGVIRMNPDWRESLEWMNTHTPETGVDYYTIYSKDTFTYPNQSYGVMSWWDYGHMITYIAKRIPNANPFQSGAGGPNSSSVYFISQSEDTANSVLDALGTRYIITDIEMDMAKFWAMATWYNTTLGVSPYQQVFLVPGQNDPASLETVMLYTPAYYPTTISRLHNFDGSLVTPGQVYYVEYTLPEVARQSYPVITGVQQMNAAEAKAAAEKYNSQAPTGKRAGVYGTTILEPVDTVPALQHYRLVHESPRNVVSGNGPDIKYVKVFEYVPGAHIRGEGTIELPLVTNTGRQFTYRQASTNGEFIVPYATTGTTSEVKATGKYRITGTGSEFEVSEDAVIGGLQVG